MSSHTGGKEKERKEKKRKNYNPRTDLNALSKEDRNNEGVNHRKRPPGKRLNDRARSSITGLSFFSPRDLVPEPLACVHRTSLGQKVGGDDGGGHLGTEKRGRVNKDDIRF